jgi:hypothetical protein
VCGIAQSKYGYKRIVAVGDGATDMEARQPDAANIFIGCVQWICFAMMSSFSAECRFRTMQQ